MLKLAFHGQSCFLVEGDGHQIIIDPWITGNPLSHLKIEDLKVEGILVSHAHHDHLGDAIPLAKRYEAILVTTVELAKYCEQQGAKSLGLYYGGSCSFPFGEVKITPALHGSAIHGEDGSEYTVLPCGFLLRMAGKTIYFAGDTALFSDMKLIGDEGLDIAIIPIGDRYTMGPKDAVRAVEFLRPKVTIPMHYNTFDFINQNPLEFKAMVEGKNLSRVHILLPGESYEVA